MDFERLSEFICIAQCGSIRKASEQLGVSAATLSARFSGFEQFVGVSLFERNSRSLVLTESGSRFLTDAKEILRSYHSVVEDLGLSLSGTFGQLTIAVAGGGLPLHLGPYLDIFNEKHPQIKLRLMDDTNCSIREGLAGGEVDLYCAPLMEDFSADQVEKIVITDADQYVLVPRGHRLASQIFVTAQELEGECFIPYPITKEPCIRDYQTAALKKAGIHYTFYDEPVSLTMHHLLVPIGKGIILSPFRLFNLPPNTVSLIVKDPPFRVSSCVLRSKENCSSEAMTFLDGYLDFVKKAGSVNA